VSASRRPCRARPAAPRRAALAAIAVLPLAGISGLTGCDRIGGKPSFRATDVTGADFGRALSLIDHTGAPRTLADWKGKVVVVFFGFTQCPDVCPTTLATMADVMKRLGPQADDVQVLFVTVDPERDTRAVMAPYVTAFDPRFVGLYGDEEATRKAAREFKVFYTKVAGSTGSTYTIDHTAASYVIDRQGRLRLYVKHAQSPEDIAADLRTLLAAG
jgi:protein SCO1/2